MADKEARRTDEVLKLFKDQGDTWAEVVAVTNPDGTVIGAGGGEAAPDVSKAEDSAATSGDLGLPVLAVRNDAGSTLVGNGDYGLLQLDALGRLRVNNVKDLQISFNNLTIANGASLSDVIDLRGQALVSITMPAAWTAANLTFQSSFNNATFQDLYDDAGAERAVVAAAARNIVVDPTKYMGAGFLKIRSGTAAAAVAQGAERVLVIGTVTL